MDYFDTGRFITEIEVRRGIWDVSSVDYTNKVVKRQLWMEIVNIFGGENLSESEKEELGISLKKKWKNIRDCFQRELRRSRGVKSGSTAKRKSTYTYFNLLQFLLSEIDGTPTGINSKYSPLTPEIDNDDGGILAIPPLEGSTSFMPKRKAKSECEEVPVSVLLNEGIHHGVERDNNLHDSDCDRLFLLSMLDGFRNIPPAAKMRARIEVIKIVEKYQPHRLQIEHLESDAYSGSHIDYMRGSENFTGEAESEYSDESR